MYLKNAPSTKLLVLWHCPFTSLTLSVEIEGSNLFSCSTFEIQENGQFITLLPYNTTTHMRSTC